VHSLFEEKERKTGACAVKLDMAKAYDRVEWDYLRAIMEALGFSDRWCDLVMRYVTSVSFTVRVNGNFSPVFSPTRGFRQGDPMSPYLFLLCEGLISMLKARGLGFLSRGIRVRIHAPWISHLLFADDSIVFIQANQRSADRLTKILETYRRGSGQLINKQRSAVFFSANCDRDTKETVKSSLQIESEALSEKYLGLPTAVGKVADRTFVWSKTLQPDAEEILRLRPGFRMEQDTTAWSAEKNGLYSVRSAYRLLKAEQTQMEASKLSEPSSSVDALTWKKLWKLNVPQKIRIFWWRAVNNFLPTKLELHRRHVEQGSFSVTCGADGESLYHVAFECPIARRFWKVAQQMLEFKLPELHPASWMKDVTLGVLCSGRESELIISGVWSLWSGRKARKHGRNSWNHVAAVKHISTMLEDLI
jgi:hypothetical protein